jgi:plasmid stability protein
VKHLTVRNVPEALAERLDEARRARGRSLNQTVLDLLAQALGVAGERTNGLHALAGSWTPEEQAVIERAIADSERVDEELWR